MVRACGALTTFIFYRKRDRQPCPALVNDVVNTGFEQYSGQRKPYEDYPLTPLQKAVPYKDGKHGLI